MTTLKYFPEEDRGRIDEKFFKNEKTITEDDLRGDPKPVENPGDLEAIKTVLDGVVSGRLTFDQLNQIDAEVAPVVHQNLNLSRRQASCPGIWHWMAVIFHPEFVRHRWPYDATDRTVNSMREKFLGAGTDIYSNAFGRLWWMAELSYDDQAENPYHVTREALQFQFLANRLFDPSFARYRPAVIAFAEGLSDKSSDTVRHANRRFNQALSTIQIEGRSKKEMRDIVDDVVEGVKEDFDV